jgi:hypothetical protein
MFAPALIIRHLMLLGTAPNVWCLVVKCVQLMLMNLPNVSNVLILMLSLLMDNVPVLPPCQGPMMASATSLATLSDVQCAYRIILTSATSVYLLMLLSMMMDIANAKHKAKI